MRKNKNNSKKKSIKQEYALKNINLFYNLLESRFEIEYEKYYIKEILKLSTSFNIRLTREQKQKICKKCYSYLNSENKQIRLNKNNCCIEHICLNCGNVRRYKYK